MSAVPRNDVVAFVAGSLAGESPLSVEDAVAAALRLLDEFDDHGWSVEDGKIPPMDEIHVEFAGLDLTPKWIALGPRRYDVLPSGTAERAVADAVASTLAYVASWQAEPDVADYRARADQIRAVGGRWSELTCCPVCSEIVCDDDCPLYLVRDAAGCWVGSSGAVVECEIVDDEISSEPVEEPEVDEDLPDDSLRRLGPNLDSLASQERSMGIDDVLTINDHMVSIQGTGETARFRWLGSNGVSRETALRHAAWIVAMGDPLDERFPKILDAVRST